MNFRRLHLGLGLALVLAAATASAGFAQTVNNLGPNPELPPPPAATAAPVTPAPAASSTAGPRRGRRGSASPGPASSPTPEATDTPEPPQFTTLDGIWEVELQPLGKRLATYTHLQITVTGSTIAGYYEHTPGRTRDKMTGTFDGRLITMTVTAADGTTSQFSGYVENFADMVGLYRTSDKDQGTAFTAQHRKKQKG